MGRMVVNYFAGDSDAFKIHGRQTGSRTDNRDGPRPAFYCLYDPGHTDKICSPVDCRQNVVGAVCLGNSLRHFLCRKEMVEKGLRRDAIESCQTKNVKRKGNDGSFYGRL